jgi:hypothetical protein
MVKHQILYYIFFGGLKFVVHYFDYVAHFVVFRDVWIQAHRAAVATSNWATHLPKLSHLYHQILGMLICSVHGLECGSDEKKQRKLCNFKIIKWTAALQRFLAQVAPQVKQRFILVCYKIFRGRSCEGVSRGAGCRRQQRLTPLPAGSLLPTQQHSAPLFLNRYRTYSTWQSNLATAFVNRNLFWSMFLVKKCVR